AEEYLAAAELGRLPAADIIHRSLIINSVIATTSLYASRSQLAVHDPNLQEIVQIGAGLQGAVFEQAGTALAFKKEYPENASKQTNLAHEYGIHSAVSAAFVQFANTHSGIHVPKLFGLIHDTGTGQNTTFWEQNLHKFPSKYHVKGTVAHMERILPLPKVVRKALVSYFYPWDNHGTVDHNVLERVLNDPPNKHCLARTYLGRATGTFTKDKFSLRNFPLYLGAMEQLNLDVHGLAASMGKAFAIMHWGAGVNGDDVEFVLGTSVTNNDDSTASYLQHRAVGYYLLDFGQCDLVDLSGDVEDVYQAFKGAMVTGDNQLFIPYYAKSKSLFAAFKAGYISAGESILAAKGLSDKFSIEDFMREYEEYAEDFL
ncbi:hypothetical protein V8F20_010253, partial [Naviculisporaceae sp. PSN 640]